MVINLAVFPMHRDKILGLGQGEHELQFLLAGMAGNMHLSHFAIYHIRPLAEQHVDDV